jgi:hypothetical protein
MLTKFGEMITANVEVRQHNGTCEFGAWMHVASEDVPYWARPAIADEIAENDADEGIVSQGGCAYVWRKADAP